MFGSGIQFHKLFHTLVMDTKQWADADATIPPPYYRKNMLREKCLLIAKEFPILISLLFEGFIFMFLRVR